MDHLPSSDTLIETVCSAEPALRRVDQRQVYNATVLYLFRGLNQKAYAARLKRLLGVQPNIKALTESLSGNGYIVKNLKVWMFYVVKNRLEWTEAKALAKKWEICVADFKAMSTLSRTSMAYLNRLGRKYKALTLEVMDKNIASITVEIKTWLGKFVSKKHRFVIQSQGLERTDIEGELTYQGIRGLFNQYPLVESKLHAINVVKRVIHNQGINLIYKYTTQKNGRLTTEADGTHQARVIALSEVHTNTVLVVDREREDLKSDVHLYLQQVNQPKKRRFLELLCGNYCPLFTAWLCQRGYEVDTNEDLVERVKSHKYMVLVLEHLEVSLDAGRRYVLKLQRRFQDYTTRVATAWTALPV